MRKKAPQHKSKPADTLLKTSRKKDIELTEKELGKVSGGRFILVGLKGVIRSRLLTRVTQRILVLPSSPRKFGGNLGGNDYRSKSLATGVC